MMTTTLPVMMPAMAEIFLAAAGMALLMYGVFTQRDGQSEGTAWGTIVAMLVAAGLVIIYGGPVAGEPAFYGQFATGHFTQFAKVLILVGAAVAVWMSVRYMRAESSNRFEFPVLVLFATIGMLVMVSANDLIALYMGIELQSLSLYVIASIRRDSLRATEAGLKYFVLGAVSSGMLLYGCSLIYGFSGTTQFAGLATVLTGEATPLGLIVGLVFLISGLAFKISAVPFHMWTPDVYEGAPTPVTAFFAVAPKIAAVCLILRTMMGPFGGLIADWQQVITLIAIASMVLGAIAAIQQTNLKRLMAYSSIGHMGFALVGVAAGNQAGAQAVLIYMAIYLFMNVGTFAVILSMRKEGRYVENIADLAGLNKSHPLMALAMLIFMFSMAGIPPLAGFFSKWYVFFAAIEAGLFGLAVIGVLASVVGAFYYIRIIKVMYFDEAEAPLDSKISREMRIIMGFTAVVSLLFFILPAPVVDQAAAAAQTLFTN